MPKTYKITTENSQELRDAMSQKENIRHCKKLLAVALRGEGRSNHEISEITGYHATYISLLVASYYNNGISALLLSRDYPNRRNMTTEEEEAFLSQFRDAAENGQVITAAEIAVAYDKKIGKEHKSKSTVYNLLHRHNWRIIVPRREHPKKASEEDIKSSKKLTPNMENCGSN
jgi:transposase